MKPRALPENTIRFLASFGREAVAPVRDAYGQVIPDAYRIHRIRGVGPQAFMFDECVIDADTKFPETPV